MDLDNQPKNKGNPFWIKGVSGNPKGRPKGKTMKEYAKEYLACMTDDEKDTFFDGLTKELIWKMAEGNPETKADLKIDNTQSFTKEELEAAKELIVKRLGQSSSTTTQPSI